MDLCLSVFRWAEFRIKTSIPSLVLITSTKVYDMNMPDAPTYEAGSFHIMDKGYIDSTQTIQAQLQQGMLRYKSQGKHAIP